MLPDLNVLDVRWEGSALSVRNLIERCMSLEELHADLQVCKLALTVPIIDLPQSLLHLRVLKYIQPTHERIRRQVARVDSYAPSEATTLRITERPRTMAGVGSQED